MARLPSGTTPFMQRPTQRADTLGLGKTPKRLLKVSGKHFGSQKQPNTGNRTPAYSRSGVFPFCVQYRAPFRGGPWTAGTRHFCVGGAHEVIAFESVLPVLGR